jgi:TetR/AcrR family acrAB operon transcriptional repressor
MQARETRQQIIDAARMVFHQWGVSHSSLDKVARMAGLTRGAIYWHFKDKAELFLAVRANVLFPVFEEIDSMIGSGAYVDPLDGIETALRRFFQILDDCPGVRMLLETLVNRCERVAEFAGVQSELDGRAAEFLARLEPGYRQAAALGTLRPGLDPRLVARDTSAFTYGLVYRLLAGGADGGFQHRVAEMIALHMSLRRLRQMPHGETRDTSA